MYLTIIARDSMSNVPAIKNRSGKWRPRRSQTHGFPVWAVHDVKIRHRTLRDDTVRQTTWMRCCLGCRRRHRLDGLQRVEVASLHHQRTHERQTERLAVWIEIGCKRERNIMFDHPFHVWPRISHSIGRARKKARVDTGTFHFQPNIIGGVVGMVGSIDTQ